MCCCDKEGLLDRPCESPVVVAVCAVPKICANDGAWCNPPLLVAAAAPSSTCETSSLPPAPETTFTSCINSVSSANVCAPSAVSVPPGVVSVRRARGEKSKTSVLLCGQRKEKRPEKKRHHHQNHETITNNNEIIESSS